MASRVGDIVIDCTDPELLAAFWAEVLAYRIFDRDETGVAIRGASVSPDILFIRVPEGKPGEPTTDRPADGRRHNRLHLDIRIGDDDRDEVVAKLIARGATRLWDGQQGPHTWVTMADPEGNEFCVA
ncbi:VOC family protein [Hamadaea tsunoensis]|uniref:VOC family protein n=1 Tax=Hamadaea tsunoensis TaxID=53368 RepID=UPI0004820C3C|nr:VOC family protein [Hamadaea tsunoensis]